MRTFYFLRHGEPDFPQGERVCLGRMDVSLSPFGRLQAAVAARALAELPIAAVFCSPLLRARQTADLLHCPYQILEGLQEIDTGAWDGHSFEEIRRNWPELYERRGTSPFLSFPKAEPQGLSLLRFLHAVGKTARGTGGNLLFVTHAGILRLFFAAMRDLPSLDALPFLVREDVEARLRSAADDNLSVGQPPGYGSISTVKERNGCLTLPERGRVPHPVPDRRFCLALLDAANLPLHIRRHSEAVAGKALELADALEAAGHPLRKELVLAASLLHDIVRMEKHHAEKGAAALERLGYPNLAAPVRTHHNLPLDAPLDEAAILFLADKLILEDCPATLRQRFERSLKKCLTKEQKRRHDERWHTSLSLAKRINEICGNEIAVIG